MANDIFPGASLVQLLEWGYPMGSRRPTPPAHLAFSVVHITANLASAQNEAAWRLNDPGLQNSATFFVNRDGSVVQCLGDPLHMDPWTNGDIQRPDLTNPRIAALGGVNPNERSLVTIENVGREPEAPITVAQEATNGRIIAYYHAKAGLPVSRETVIGHYQINSVNRPNCPSTNKSVIDRIVALAGGDSMTTVELALFPEGPRRWQAKTSKVYTGYKPDGATKQVTLNVGSWARSDGIATITQNPQKAPNGSGFVRVLDGAFAGYYLLGADVTLDPPPPSAGTYTQAQLDDAVAKAAMDAKVAAAKAAATEAAKRVADYRDSLP